MWSFIIEGCEEDSREEKRSYKENYYIVRKENEFKYIAYNTLWNHWILNILQLVSCKKLIIKLIEKQYKFKYYHLNNNNA